MSQDTTVSQEIEHLDFDVKDKEVHYAHPIDAKLHWCGKPRKNARSGEYIHGAETKPSEITCVDCLHLYIEKGGAWWWNVHHAWYGGGTP